MHGDQSFCKARADQFFTKELWPGLAPRLLGAHCSPLGGGRYFLVHLRFAGQKMIPQIHKDKTALLSEKPKSQTNGEI